jgi:hypothetical protein
MTFDLGNESLPEEERPVQRDLETITKWGLGGFLLVVHTCLHPGIPAT